MAIALIANGEGGASVRAKLNDAIARGNEVDSRLDQKLIPVRELVVDGDALLVPGVFFWDKGDRIAATPPDGNYWEVQLSAPSGVVRWFYLNRSLIPANPVVIVDLDANPKTDTAGLALIGYSLNGVFYSDLPVLGQDGVGVGVNCFAAGKWLDAVASFVSPTTVVVAAHASLATLGFDRAAEDLSAAQIYAWGDIPNPTPGLSYVAARVIVRTTVANDFGSEVRINFFRGDEFVGQRNMVLEKKISSNLAIYSVFDNLSIAGINRFNIGMTQTAAGRNQIAGMQVAFAHDPIRWIMRGDYPADPMALEPVIGKHLWGLPGREMAIYPSNLISAMTDQDVLSAGFWTVKASDAGFPHVVRGEKQLMLRPDKWGTSGALEVRRKGHGAQRSVRDIVRMILHTATAGARTIKILMIGDSLTNRRMAAKITPKLVALGITPEWIGTMRGSDSDNIGTGANMTDATGPLGEGREGWKIAEFINLVTTYAPAANDWSAYLAGDKAYRQPRNPFLKAPSGEATSGANQLVYNGWVFSLANYLAQTGQPVPDVILIGLGTNDMPSADYLTYLSTGLRVMLAQCRAAAPNARIGWWFPINPTSYGGLGARAKSQAIIRQSVAQIIALNDPKTFTIPTWASIDPDFGWLLNAVSPNGIGVERQTALNDITHLGTDPAPVREQVAEILSAFIAA